MKHMRPALFAAAGLSFAAAAVGLASSVLAQHAGHHTVVSADEIKWGPAPPSLPPGAEAAVLLGSPAKEGPFVLRLKFPAGFLVPPHRHSKDELVTVIAGKLVIGSGEAVDRASLNAQPAASFFHLPAGMAHYASAEVETIVQINGVGPFDITYINPQDDPRKKTN